MWSQKAKKYLQKEDLGVDLLWVQEHRTRGRAKEDMQRAMQSKGWKTVASEAALTQGGNSGGVMLAARGHLDFTTLHQDEVAGIPTSQKGVTLLLVSIDLVTWEGPTGENIDILKKVGTIIQAKGLDWILAGDFNFSPELLHSTGWLAQAKGVVVHQEGLVSTCRKSNVRSYIPF